MGFRLQNSKHIWADFQPRLLIKLSSTGYKKVPYTLLYWGSNIFQNEETSRSIKAT